MTFVVTFLWTTLDLSRYNCETFYEWHYLDLIVTHYLELIVTCFFIIHNYYT